MRQKTYLLMNKDTPLLLFQLQDVLGVTECVEIERYIELPAWISDINQWVNGRNYAKHKEHFKKWIKEWGIDTVEGFLDITHALSLNDSLWVKQENSVFAWDNINLYHNEFTDVAEKTAFETGLAGLHLTTTSPEMTAEGSFEKCWKKEGNQIYIYKKGSSGFANAGLEPYSEFYASSFSTAYCSNSVSYDLVMFKGSLCSKCALFTNEDVGFIPFYKVFGNDQVSIAKALDYCRKLGFEDQFRRMIILDSIIFNPDRHAGNFGFLIDNNSFEIKDFAPVFDHNFSLLARAMSDDLCNEQSWNDYIATQGHKLGGSYLDVGKAILTPEIKETIFHEKNHTIQLHGKYNLPPERISTLNSIIENQVDQLLEEPFKRKIIFVNKHIPEPELEEEPEL